MANSIRFDASVNDKVSGPLDRIRSKIDAIGKTGAGKGILAGVAGAATLGAIGLVAGAIGGVVDKLGEAAAAYREDEASQARLRASLEANVPAYTGNTDAIEKVIASRMRLGFSDDEQRASLAQLVTRTHDSTKALELQQTAMDLARLKGMSLEAATNLIGKAYSGQVSALTRAGIAVDKNATATEALAAVQKAARGQAEAFANTSEGRVLASQLKVGESMERIGLVIARLSDAVIPILADAFEGIVNVLGDVGAEVERFVAENRVLFDMASQLAGVLVNVLGAAFGFVANNVRIAFGVIADVVKAVYDVIKGVVSGIIGTIRNVVAVAAEIPGPWQDAAKQMVTTLDGMQASVQSWGQNTSTLAGKAADDIVANTASGLAGGAGAVGAGAEAGIADPMVEAAQDGAAGALGVVQRTPRKLSEALLERRNTWKSAWEKYKDILSGEMDKGAEIAKLKGILSSKKLAQGLKSQDPVVAAAARELQRSVKAELERLENGTRVWGKNAGVAFAVGLKGTQAQVARAAAYIAQAAANNLEIRSPAKEGPLSRGGFEVWGARAASLFAEGMMRRVETVRTAAARVAGAAVPGTSMGGTMTLAPAYATTRPVASGGDVHVHFHSTVPPSAAQREELERMLTPIIVGGLQRRRILSPSGTF